MTPLPDFRDPEFLRGHILRTMAFYDGRCVDPDGGFFHFFKDDGRVFDRHTRHLVSSTRFVYTHAMAGRRFPAHPRAGVWKDAAAHGLRFVRQAHRSPDGEGYAWLLHCEGPRCEVRDATRHCYGLAFVLLAHAHAAMAGIDEARAGIAETADLMERGFWEPANGLYADEATPDGVLSPYRGQNANMHACEAMLAAHDATGEARYLERAATLADSVTVTLAAQGRGLIWEHYRAGDGGGWVPDWDYNRHDRSNIFRPWGYQTGHLTEWAKLLVLLERKLPDPDDDDDTSGRVHRARTLFAAAMAHGWDARHGGLVYGFAGSHDAAGSDGRYTVCDADKYHWVQAESIAAAALLGQRTGEGGYWDWYDRLWTNVWQHFVDHTHGAWYRILAPDHGKLTDEKSPAGKVDYHNMGACHDVLDALAR